MRMFSIIFFKLSLENNTDGVLKRKVLIIIQCRWLVENKHTYHMARKVKS